MLLKLITLLTPLGQGVDVSLQAGHIGIGVVLKLGLQIIQAALRVLQIACDFTVAVVQLIALLGVGIFTLLEFALVAV